MTIENTERFVEYSVEKAFVKRIVESGSGIRIENVGWKFYASSGQGDRSGYFDTYDEAVDWIASLEG